MSALALMFGVIAIVFSFIPGLNFIAPIFGVIGIALGYSARKKLLSQGRPADIATGGMITSIVGTVFGLLFYLACAACLGGSGLMMDKMMRDIQEQGFDMQRLEEQMKQSMEKAIEEGRKQDELKQAPVHEEKVRPKPNQI
ncbi:MAG TPA: hypothetical protein PK926_04830 [Spirochaetota bacterium]|nr:hypothetical protein [Spirochaetota bacterium]HPI88904.1 hypothetical protein [Spirochaetota bacterium]HPR46966.1 hypothetical protein [Spirochaetota bacterium]